MKSKDLLIVLLLAAGGLWFGFNKKGKDYNFAAPHQHQLDRAKALQGQVQAEAAQRDKDIDSH